MSTATLAQDGDGLGDVRVWGVLLLSPELRPTRQNGLVGYLERFQLSESGGRSAHWRLVEPLVPAALRPRFAFDLGAVRQQSQLAGGDADLEAVLPPSCVVPLFGEEASLGRYSTSVLLPNPTLSHRHCAFKVLHVDPVAVEGKEVEDREEEERVMFTDVSSCGCHLVRAKTGERTSLKGTREPVEIATGDVIELNKPPTSSKKKSKTGVAVSELQLAFTFYRVEDFVAKMGQTLEEEEGGDDHCAPEALVASTATSVSDLLIAPPAAAPQPQAASSLSTALARDREDAAQKSVLQRCEALWRAESRVRRVYQQNFNEYYRFNNNIPHLGKGGFGVVRAAALRIPSGADAVLRVDDSSHQLSLLPVLPAVVFPPLDGILWSEEELEQMKAHYIRLAIGQPPATAVALHNASAGGNDTDAAAVAAAAAVGEKRPREPESNEEPRYCFAVKIIEKVSSVRKGEETEEKTARIMQNLREQETPLEEYAAVQLHEEIKNVKQQLRIMHGGGESIWKPAWQDSNSVSQSLFLLGESQSVAAVVGTAHHSELSESRYAAPSSTASGGSHDFTQEVETRQSRRRKQREYYLAQLPSDVKRKLVKEKETITKQQREIDILLRLNTCCHKNIVQLVEVFEFPDKRILVMERANGGQLFDFIMGPPKPFLPRLGANSASGGRSLYSCRGPLPEFLSKVIVYQLLQALKYMHSMGVVHRDIKLENVLFAEEVDVCRLYHRQLECMSANIRALLSAKTGGAPGGPPGAKAPAGQTESQEEGGGEGCEEKIGAAGSGGRKSDTSGSNAPEDLVSNVLCPCYYLHLPPAEWPVVKLTDFGLSNMASSVAATAKAGAGGGGKLDTSALLGEVYDNGLFETQCGTATYVAPEVTNPHLRKKSHGDKDSSGSVGYTADVDLFSLGILCFALLTQRAPFGKNQRTNTLDYDAEVQYTRTRTLEKDVQLPAAVPDKNAPALIGGLCTMPHFKCGGVSEDARGGGLTHRCLSVIDEKLESRIRDGKGGGRHDDADAVWYDILKRIEKYIEYRKTIVQCDVDLDLWVAEASGAAELDRNKIRLLPVSPLGIDFIRRLLKTSPSERMTVTEALQHPWLRECAFLDQQHQLGL